MSRLRAQAREGVIHAMAQHELQLERGSIETMNRSRIDLWKAIDALAVAAQQDVIVQAQRAIR